MSRYARFALSLLVAVPTAALSVGCEETTEPVAEVVLSHSSASVEVGDTLRITATTYDASGQVLSPRSVSWSSADTTVAAVDDEGLVTGVAEGSTTITATSEGVSASATVAVSASQ
jgi:uncharacterized protein YjdB